MPAVLSFSGFIIKRVMVPRISITKQTDHFRGTRSLLRTRSSAPLPLISSPLQPSKLRPRLAAVLRASPHFKPHSSRSTTNNNILAMATATNIHLDPLKDVGVYSSGIREDAARVTSKVLQEDMERHHVFFNDEGFHNHIVHGVLTLYALGASSDNIVAHYERNKSYQRPAYPIDKGIVQTMHDSVNFQSYLGKAKQYSNFLSFFQTAIDTKGVDLVLEEYIFAGDDRAETMLCRLFGGLVHPLIHLGFGLEFNQPAIVAQALAQAAVHDDWMGREYFLPAEKMAGEIGKPGQKSLLQLLNEIQRDNTLKSSVKFSDSNKFRDGVLHRAPKEMLQYAAQYTVSEEQIPERVADMINTVVHYTSAAQRRDKEVKIDFFFIHNLNSSIFFSTLMDLPLLGQKSKCRLLEWKGRLDLLTYVSRNSPDLLLEEVTNYPAKQDWEAVISQSVAHPHDDGHLVKLVRAVAHGQNVCRPFEKKAAMPISGDMWLKIGNMAVDSTDGCGTNGAMWIRSTGFDEAWVDISGRARL
ncbi:hypothetical protein N7466_000612 [Penicillium verhagenii]|uniref:uncharacterized protein n=1 Tax=Penicillium verhagenii TaxID=1562060 RepID=UPI00254577CC|nr:uncharacterized protein N7466_000612 [Penicillium verhagenii]KAJ5947597.1 hypothetical protein N7466_000612 [Penicillium verhagenii]